MNGCRPVTYCENRARYKKGIWREAQIMTLMRVKQLLRSNFGVLIHLGLVAFNVNGDKVYLPWQLCWPAGRPTVEPQAPTTAALPTTAKSHVFRTRATSSNNSCSTYNSKITCCLELEICCRKGKVSRKHRSAWRKAALVLLKMFINGNKRRPQAHERTLFSKRKQHIPWWSENITTHKFHLDFSARHLD